VESAHSILKSYFQVSTGNLKRVLDKVTLLLTNQHAEHATVLDQEQQRSPHDVNIPLFTELIGKVTSFALRKILQQYQRLSSLPLPQCTNSFSQSIGLPCIHTILNRQHHDNSIYLHDIHLHWHFLRPDSIAILQPVLGPVLVHEPAVAKLKGQPRGSKNQKPASSTRREPSSFELPSRYRAT
jgi:hypothetical protein